jgi:leucyl-tRNA synthetase
MEYDFRSIEKRWRTLWAERNTYAVSTDRSKPKCYVLDMFPYPSGAGLHVGHPLGYIASDVYARYKRQRGFNVLHPMGYDAFGLPAEQYAIETGQHPAVTTENNIARYREQLDAIGFSYDWSRSFKTSDPDYYKWTQWIFLRIFHSWYDRKADKAKKIEELVKIFEKEGNTAHPCPGDEKLQFDADGWKKKSGEEQREALMNYRLAYLAYSEVWWCEALGTVLANDEVINGVSERGGHPCVRKKMRQWSLRITEYAERLLEGLNALEWTDALKEMQRNWIGKSRGAVVDFAVADGGGRKIRVFTTRPDTIFGVDFLVLAPEHDLVGTITSDEQRSAVAEYVEKASARSERDRMTEVKTVTGQFTGAYAVHPFTRKNIPIYIAEYVLAGYGTGAIMAVPSGDERDHAFAKTFDLSITNVFGAQYTGSEAFSSKEGTIENSDFLSGLTVPKAIEAAIRALKDAGVGFERTTYRLRDAGFSRQRYWGEPFPIIYRNGIPYGLDEEALPLSGEEGKLPVELPAVDSYSPGPEGQGPLANLTDWVNTSAGQRETNTMPGYAGSSWYFLRYADPNNDTEFADREATDYWGQVDVYVGGTEHAVGHLLYSRLWTKVLFDLGHIGFQEPFKKLVNQGMIQGSSRFIYFNREKNTFYSAGIANIREDKRNLETVRVDVNFTNGLSVDLEKFRQWRPDYQNAQFETEPDGDFISVAEVEKMSKSKYNVVNPDDVVAQYGADTFRMYEMFLGPLEASKPWDTQGIEGVHRFLKKLWRLYYDEATGWRVTEDEPTDAMLRTLHRTIRKIGADIEAFSFNTAVSAFMICVNELAAAGCHHRTVLEALAVILAPLAPHTAEQLWSEFGHESSVFDAKWPMWEERYVTETEKNYPVAINGKTRTELPFALDAAQADIEKAVLADATVQKWLEGKTPKKIIFVKGRMINVVI